MRFYSFKINQALQVFLVQNGFVAVTGGSLRHLRSKHFRYLAEARTAAPLRVDCGLVSQQSGSLEVLALVYDNLSNELLTSCICEFESGNWPHAELQTVSVPEIAAPRGIDLDRLAPITGLLTDALDRGYIEVGRGVAGVDEADSSGMMLPHHYIGRISDGVPNLLALIDDEESMERRLDGEIGGAVIEYNLQIHSPLEQGHIFSQLSGIRAVAGKTFHISHLILDHTLGCCAVSAEVVALGIDLVARRAIAISESQRKKLEQFLLVSP